MLKLFPLLCVIVLVKSQSTNVLQCTQHTGDLPIHTHVEGCVDPPCQLHQLEDAVIHMIFKAPRLMRDMRSLVTAYLTVGPITVPINYDLEENAFTCNFLTNSYCPVLAGEVIRYTLRMLIEPIFPVGTNAVLEFRVTDDDAEPIVCLRVAIAVLAPRQENMASSMTLK